MTSLYIQHALGCARGQSVQEDQCGGNLNGIREGSQVSSVILQLDITLEQQATLDAGLLSSIRLRDRCTVRGGINGRIL
jgi:hypothetical protein